MTWTDAASAHSFEHLSLANDVRLPRAAWRREIVALPGAEARRRLAQGLIAGLSEPVESYRLGFYLRSAWKVGPFRAKRILSRADVLPHRRHTRVRDLTRQERTRVALELCRLADQWEARFG